MQEGVLKKLDAGRAIEKGLRVVPHGMQGEDANGVGRCESTRAIMQRVIMIVKDGGHFTWTSRVQGKGARMIGATADSSAGGLEKTVKSLRDRFRCFEVVFGPNE